MNKRFLFSMVCGMMFLFLLGTLPLLPQRSKKGDSQEKAL